MKHRLNDLSREIFDDILDHGGKVYIVGGTVRDELLGIQDSHDIDVEVFHLDYNELKKLLEKYGHVNTYGQSFAIMSLDTLKGYDFALPRKERKIGEHHNDFEVMIDKDLSLKDAISRRDLTINALMYDYQKDELIDLVNGVDDLNKGLLRMVNPHTFDEDPLRILRIASFISRFEMKVDEVTKDHCIKMVQSGMLESLSIERIYQEYSKILMGVHPSLGFNFLKDIKALPDYLENLVGCYQRPDYHPEGDVWTHTMMVVDLGAACKQYSDDPLSFMWSCLLHDIGKPSVTSKEGHAPLHNEAGCALFNEVTLIQSKKMRSYINTMIMYHMHLMNMARNNSSDYKYLRLLKWIDGKVSLDDLMLISECDKLGRGFVEINQYNHYIDYINDKINRLGKEKLPPIIDGNDLIENGFEDHSQYGELLEMAYDLQIQNMSKDKILKRLRNGQG